MINLLLPSLRLRFLCLCDSHQETGSRRWSRAAAGCPLGTRCHPRAQRVVAVWGLPGLDSPPHPPGGGCPSSSATSGAWSPWNGHHPGLSSSGSHGVGGRQKSRPVGSSHRFQPGPGGLWAAVSLAKTPQTPHQRLAGSWATLSPLRPQVLGVPCHPHQSHSRGLGEGGVSITQQRLSRGQGWGGSWCRHPSQITRDCLWSVEPHRRVCTLQILQQNIF